MNSFKIILILLASTILFSTQCKKEKPLSDEEKIIGTWDLVGIKVKEKTYQKGTKEFINAASEKHSRIITDFKQILTFKRDFTMEFLEAGKAKSNEGANASDLTEDGYRKIFHKTSKYKINNKVIELTFTESGQDAVLTMILIDLDSKKLVLSYDKNGDGNIKTYIYNKVK